jgi:hypothetical protein
MQKVINYIMRALHCILGQEALSVAQQFHTTGHLFLDAAIAARFVLANSPVLAHQASDSISEVILDSQETSRKTLFKVIKDVQRSHSIREAPWT